MSLAALGLTVRDERVYRALLGRRLASPAELAAAVGLAPRTCERAVATLLELRLLEADESSALGVRVRLPSLALAELAQRRAEQVSRSLVEIASVQANFVVLDELARQAAAPRTPSLGIDGTGAAAAVVVRGSDVRACIEGLARETSRSVDSITDTSPATWNAGAPDVVRTVRQGVATRWLLHRDKLALPSYQEQVRACLVLGAEVRTIGRQLSRLLIADGSTALLPDDADHPSDGLVLVRHPVVVARLQEVFELIWAASVRVRLDGGVARAEAPVVTDPSVRELLTALATGATDEVAARSLSISVRQLQRRTKTVFEQLGAVNRFDAGVRAERLGLVDDADAPPRPDT